MFKNGLVDGVIQEPIGGAHRNHQQIFETVKSEIKKHLNELTKQSEQQRVNARIEKFANMGVVHDINE